MDILRMSILICRKGELMKLSEQIKHCIDGNGCAACDYIENKITHTCKGLLQAAYGRIKKYEEIFPCNIGDTVYVIAKCEKIPQQLDGTLYNSDGSFGDATGYYCPYEDNCPFDGEDFDGCEKYESKNAVFQDTVSHIDIYETGITVFTENCNEPEFISAFCEDGDRHIFLTNEETEAALQKMNEKEGE